MRILARLVLVALCVGGIVAALVTYRSARRLDESFASLLRGSSVSDTLKLLAQSRPLNPDPRRYTLAATLLVNVGRRRRAEAIVRSAARSQPDDATIWLAWAWIAGLRHERSLARYTYARAKALDSQLPRTQYLPRT